MCLNYEEIRFKFSGADSHNEANEFQMRFYTDLAREIFSSMLGAELFYLKDGISRGVKLVNDEIQDFEEDLIRKIKGYQDVVRMPSISNQSLQLPQEP